jgi:hypothetical protein
MCGRARTALRRAARNDATTMRQWESANLNQMTGFATKRPINGRFRGHAHSATAQLSHFISYRYGM